MCSRTALAMWVYHACRFPIKFRLWLKPYLFMSGAYLHASNLAQGSLLGTFARLSDIVSTPVEFQIMRTTARATLAPPTFTDRSWRRRGFFARKAGSVMAEYKLTYLNYRGRAELIRFILSQAGVEFEDCRIAPEQWPEHRPSNIRCCAPYLSYS